MQPYRVLIVFMFLKIMTFAVGEPSIEVFINANSLHNEVFMSNRIKIIHSRYQLRANTSV